MLFCPTCANMLIISIDGGSTNHWACQTCPYKFPIKNRMSSRSKLKRKAVDDVLGTAEFGTDETDAVCPKCENDRAFFKQIQIRSADEPMTRCTNSACGNVWKED
ncbi:putative Rpc11-DNA-directed RNA polymerase III subunit C11 [Cantharellus anzutake]|uniref:putative Rpc11-DNA-directed RNA polymerase III subunit C11 n=1 Tax=Cantharellus anzutake TaxID=1750568 RepID=UPI001905E941|nr:putative Rpc11-DNA-directed RNA polymerase III subunit C11 [Cantharellus anzutake]KAF8329789.1 putative Rpc11-DNA-directed RNA polymerase III subunit C11 [Cantharellus anzutake]